MPELELEVTAMLSRATERVGLKRRKPPCPKPSRLDDWFLGVACVGSQHPAPGASLPDVHEGLTGRGRHLLLPETDLLTPPPSPPSVVQLGVTGVPPVERSVAMQVCPYTVFTRQGKPCLLFRACRYSSGLIRRGLFGLWRCCLHLMLRRYCRSFRLKALRDMHGGGYDPEVLKELRTAPDLTPRATKVMARSLGHAMSTLVVQERHLWLCLLDIRAQLSLVNSRAEVSHKMKTLLLLALNSIKRVGDLHAFSVDESCLKFGPADSQIILRLRSGYVPKVSTSPFGDQVVSL